MNFFGAMLNELNKTTTDNGANAYNSTLNPCLDFFSKANRNNVSETARLFMLAFNDNPETAMRTLFYFRDVRNGQGERKFVHECLRMLVTHPKINALIKLIPEYGYWKDLLVFHGTVAWVSAMGVISEQFHNDMKSLNTDNKSVSLLGKWLPSENSGKKSSIIARDIMTALGLTPRAYRKSLTRLRDRINIVETKMCSNNWSDIEYSAVPSKASLMYRKAFSKHDAERYVSYLKDVKSGNAKINAATLYPSDIVSKVRDIVTYKKNYGKDNTSELAALDSLWKSLPNYITSPYNGIVIADTSGSMTSPKVGSVAPIDVSIAIATYIAERNPSPVWKNKFIIFSSKPELLTLSGDTISSYIRCYQDIVSSNTDFVKVANSIVNAGKNAGLSDDDMPKNIIVISDMQFDNFDQINVKISGDKTPHEKFSSIFTEAGYSVPNIIYWNVNNSKNVPVKFDNVGTAMVTGYSPVIMKSIINAKTIDPVEIMITTVYNSRYDSVGKLFSDR